MNALLKICEMEIEMNDLYQIDFYTIKILYIYLRASLSEVNSDDAFVEDEIQFGYASS